MRNSFVLRSTDLVELLAPHNAGKSRESSSGTSSGETLYSPDLDYLSSLAAYEMYGPEGVTGHSVAWPYRSSSGPGPYMPPGQGGGGGGTGPGTPGPPGGPPVPQDPTNPGGPGDVPNDEQGPIAKMSGGAPGINYQDLRNAIIEDSMQKAGRDRRDASGDRSGIMTDNNGNVIDQWASQPIRGFDPRTGLVQRQGLGAHEVPLYYKDLQGNPVYRGGGDYTPLSDDQINAQMAQILQQYGYSMEDLDYGDPRAAAALAQGGPAQGAGQQVTGGGSQVQAPAQGPRTAQNPGVYGVDYDIDEYGYIIDLHTGDYIEGGLRPEDFGGTPDVAVGGGGGAYRYTPQYGAPVPPQAPSTATAVTKPAGGTKEMPVGGRTIGPRATPGVNVPTGRTGQVAPTRESGTRPAGTVGGGTIDRSQPNAPLLGVNEGTRGTGGSTPFLPLERPANRVPRPMPSRPGIGPPIPPPGAPGGPGGPGNPPPGGPGGPPPTGGGPWPPGPQGPSQGPPIWNPGAPGERTASPPNVWGEGGASGNRAIASRELFNNLYSMIYGGGYSPGEQTAMEQEAIGAAKAATGSARGQIMRNAATTGGSAGVPAGLAYLGRAESKAASDAARGVKLSQAQERIRQREAGLQGMGQLYSGEGDFYMNLFGGRQNIAQTQRANQSRSTGSGSSGSFGINIL